MSDWWRQRRSERERGVRGPVLGDTEILQWGTQGDPGSKGAQRGQGNVGRTARTGESPETCRIGEVALGSDNTPRSGE